MAAAWAVMPRLGLDGYTDLTRTTIGATRRLVDGVDDIGGLAVVGRPDAQIVAISSDPSVAPPVDAFAVGDMLADRGWYVDRQTRPDSLHLTVSAGNAPVVEEFLADLGRRVAQAGGARTSDRSTSYSTLE